MRSNRKIAQVRFALNAALELAEHYRRLYDRVSDLNMKRRILQKEQAALDAAGRAKADLRRLMSH